MLLNDRAQSDVADSQSQNDRRENPRYHTSFLKRNLIALHDDFEIIYDGLVSIINISRDGMCVKVSFSDTRQAAHYSSGKRIKILIDLPFTGKIIKFVGLIAWIRPDYKELTYRIGLQVSNCEQSQEGILDFFDDETKAQRTFYERIV